MLQLKLHFYTIVHFLLEEFNIMSHNKSLSRIGVQFFRAGVWSPKFSNPGVGSRNPTKHKDSASPVLYPVNIMSFVNVLSGQFHTRILS